MRHYTLFYPYIHLSIGWSPFKAAADNLCFNIWGNFSFCIDASVSAYGLNPSLEVQIFPLDHEMLHESLSSFFLSFHFFFFSFLFFSFLFFSFSFLFLVADTQLYERLCPSVHQSVGLSVSPSWSLNQKIGKRAFWILFVSVWVLGWVRVWMRVGCPCPTIWWPHVTFFCYPWAPHLRRGRPGLSLKEFAKDTLLFFSSLHLAAHLHDLLQNFQSKNIWLKILCLRENLHITSAGFLHLILCN